MVKKIFNIIREGAYVIFAIINKEYASLAHTSPALFNERLYLWFIGYHFAFWLIILEVIKQVFNIELKGNIIVLISTLAIIFISNHHFFFRVIDPMLSKNPYEEGHQISHKFIKGLVAGLVFFGGMASIFILGSMVSKFLKIILSSPPT